MVQIEQFSKQSVDYIKKYLMKDSADAPDSWSSGRFWGYLNKIDPNSIEDKPLPLCITYRVSDDMDAEDVKKSLRRFKNKLKYYSNDAEGVYRLEFNKSGKVYAHMILGGDDVPSKKWILNALEDDDHDASKS
jgi:hypothetical protein